MKLGKAIQLAILCLAGAAFAQASGPATRPGTVGRIAASDQDVTPLETGARVPPLVLKTSEGKSFDLNAALARKPTILIFYRGGWCPFCMRQLSGIQGVLDLLDEAGWQVLAISPDKPEQLARTAESDQLTFPLLSDSDAAAIKAFGLAFQASASQFKTLEDYSGATHHAIPIPAVYLVGTDGTVKFVHHDPDYKVRMNPSEVLDKARSLLAAPAR
jgi:peroxiredoxin